MINDDMIAVPIACVAGNSDGSVGSGIDRGSLGCGKIKTCMKFYSFIDRVNAITKTGSNTVKIFIAYWLNGRSGNESCSLFFRRLSISL